MCIPFLEVAGCLPVLDWPEASPPRVSTAGYHRAVPAPNCNHARPGPPSPPRCSQKECPDPGLRVFEVAKRAVCTVAQLLKGQERFTEEEAITTDKIKHVAEDALGVPGATQGPAGFPHDGDGATGRHEDLAVGLLPRSAAGLQRARRTA